MNTLQKYYHKNCHGSSGDNYWCVLFPPLCMMDAKETNMDDIEYTSFIKETINRIFKKHN